MRNDRVRNTVQVWADSEAGRPGRLERAAASVAPREESHARRLESNWRRAEGDIDRNIRRWENRQPDYRRKIIDLLDGKPENIERPLVIFFI